MPLRDVVPDQGFTFGFGQLQPDESAQHAAADGEVNPNALGDVLSVINAPLAPTVGIQAFQRNQELFDAAFRLENPVLAAVDWLTRPRFNQVDPNFDVATQLKKDGLWDQYRDNFLGVQSLPEYLDIAHRIAREENDHRIIERNGLAGGIAATLAGATTPTALIPLAGEAGGILGVIRAAALGGGAALLDEVPLQLDQETRSLGTSAANVAWGTIFGAVLGGAHSYLTRPLDEIERDMVNVPGTLTIQPSAASVGAEAIDRPMDFRLRSAGPEVGGKSALDVASTRAGGFNFLRSPVVQVLNQDTSKFGRWMMSQLSDAGLQFEREVDGKVVPYSAAPAGTVESRWRLWWAAQANSIRKVDEEFAKYWLGKSQVNLVDKLRAGLAPAGVKMNRRQFREAVADAMNNGDQHDIPEVAQVAQHIRQTIYDPLLEQAQKLGMFKGLREGEDGIETIGDLSYLNRLYNLNLISARRVDFINILTDHFKQKLQTQWDAAYQKFADRRARDVQRLSDAQLLAEQVEAEYNKFMVELKALDKATAPEQDQKNFFAAMAKKASTDAERASLQQQADAIELPETELKRQARVREVKKRIHNLNRSVGMANKQLGKKLAKIDRSEELQLASLNRAVRRAQKFLTGIDKLSDENFEKRISELKDDFAEAGEKFDRNEERISKTLAEGDDVGAGDKLFAIENRQENLTGRMSDLADELGQLESTDRAAARDAVQEGLDAMLAKVNDLNSRRALRAQRLREAAAQLDPEVVKKGIADLQTNMHQREQEFLDKWEVRAGGSQRVTGAANFDQYAKDLATATTNKILGTYARLPGFDIMVGDRGPELLRTLDISADKLHTPDGKSFLERDIHKLTHAYIRTLAPDIEITKKFGEIEPESGHPVVFMQLEEEHMAQEEALKATAAEKKWSQEKLDKATLKLKSEYDEIKRNLDGVIGRLRGTWGLPKDPHGMTARLGRIALNLNTLRYMGMVSVSSIPDLAQPIIKHGLLRTFRDGYVPFIQAMFSPEWRATSRRELGYTSAGWELVLHSRSDELQNIQDYMVRGSPFEKSLEWASGKTGLVGLFDLWTTGMKQITGTTAIARVLDALEVVNGGKATARELADATEYLAQGNIDGPTAQMLWRELTKEGGGNKVEGRWWPNTEKWSDEAATTFRQMINREIDRTIITPGVERPLIADRSLATRLLFQFKSFGMASNTKTVLSGLQQRGMANVANQISGALFSLALGTVSYILWARLTGGTAEAEMENAVAEGRWEKFADEAISRSGLIGQMGDVQDILSNIPLTAPHVTFSGQKTTRRAGQDLGEALLGPTYGSMFQTGLSIVTGPGVDKNTGEFKPPTQSWVHQLRLLLPLQNNWALRRGFDMIEDAVGSNLPEHH